MGRMVMTPVEILASHLQGAIIVPSKKLQTNQNKT